MTFATGEELDAYIKSQGRGFSGSCSVQPVYQTVHQDGTGHYEDVITSYQCATCGAVQ